MHVPMTLMPSILSIYIGCEKFSQHDLYPIAIGGVR